MNRHPPRLYSLDVFRGLTIAGMILVNSPGGDEAYAWLRHSPWHGCTPADLVFPSFLVIMGASLAISLGRRLERGESPAGVARQAARRAAVIFGLGLVMSALSISYFGMFRIPGVLQRIAVCYLGCSLLFLGAAPRALARTAVFLLAGYWALLSFWPVPGRGAGDLSPDGNLASYVDRLVFGGHMWAETHDPEGLLSTLPAMATALIGVLAGLWLRSHRRLDKKARDLFAAGLLLAAAGLLWGRLFPLNKNLWTSSYALFSGGAALCGLASCYWAVEVAGLRAWGGPFAILGRNPLLSYFISEFIYGLQWFVRLPQAGGGTVELRRRLCALAFGWLSPPAASLAYSVTYLALCVALMRAFHRRRIFLKI